MPGGGSANSHAVARVCAVVRVRVRVRVRWCVCVCVYDRVTIKNTKHFGTLARRLYRIFAFSYFVHREQFDEFEVSPLN